jgi:hypothetical protein
MLAKALPLFVLALEISEGPVPVVGSGEVFAAFTLDMVPFRDIGGAM